jgi:hypothetical protein
MMLLVLLVLLVFAISIVVDPSTSSSNYLMAKFP